jgi:lipoyl(octanoyl) transferase
MPLQKVQFEDLGRMNYQSAWDYQEQLLARNVEIKSSRWRNEAGEANVATETDAQTTHHLLFVEHPPVYTLGKSGKIEHVLISEEERRKNDLEFFRINREFIVGIESIEKMIAVSISRVKLSLHPPAEQETIVSTERSPDFKKWLADS